MPGKKTLLERFQRMRHGKVSREQAVRTVAVGAIAVIAATALLRMGVEFAVYGRLL